MALGAEVLKNGGLVAFPTETVYGLGANLLDRRAMRNLRNVKNRPKGKPFTVHIADKKIIKKMGCGIIKKASFLIKRYWPGPLTIILKAKNGRKIGFRMPDNKIALELLKRSGLPIAAPSANVSGDTPPTTADRVIESLCGKVDVVIDGGRTRIGKESTVVDVSSGSIRVLREGAIKKKELLRLWGR